MRAMILLAEQPGEELVSASELSRHEHIPLKYLEQLLSELKKANLVISHPGARGGYRLARPGSAVPVSEIVRALDGPFAPMSCVADGKRPPCAFETGCKLRPLWSKLHAAVHEVLDSTTLDQLASGDQRQDIPEAEVSEILLVEGDDPLDGAHQPHCGLLALIQSGA